MRRLCCSLFFNVCLLSVVAQQVDIAASEGKRVALSTGITMYYHEAGTPGAEAVIMLHGLAETGQSFFAVADSLQTIFPHFHILVPDLRGHGETSMPDAKACAANPAECFTLKNYAADVVAFMDKLNIKTANLVGHDVGSIMAQEVALLHPDRVRSIALLSTSVDVHDNPLMHDWLINTLLEGRWKKALMEKKPGLQWPQDAYMLTPLDADTKAEEWIAEQWISDLTANPAFVKSMVAKAAQVKLGTWYGLSQQFDQFDNTMRLKDLTVPALVLWAKQDPIFKEAPDQNRVIAALEQATAANATAYFFKPYGKKSLASSGKQDKDLGHYFLWGAPGGIARDLLLFIRTGHPTLDLYYANPRNSTEMLTAEGKAKIKKGLVPLGQ